MTKRIGKKYKLGPVANDLWAILRVDKNMATLRYSKSEPDRGSLNPEAGDEFVKLPKGRKTELWIEVVHTVKSGSTYTIVWTASAHGPGDTDDPESICLGDCPDFEIPCPDGTGPDCATGLQCVPLTD